MPRTSRSSGSSSVSRFLDFEPVQFAFGAMTRSKAITYDNLRLRAPDFVDKVDRAFAAGVKRAGFDVEVETPTVPMFQPFRFARDADRKPHRRIAHVHV